MKAFSQLKAGGRKYLLIPVMPTPNGGMHLGHLSGPFLKMDVLARAQRRNGNETSLFFGTDVYESYMNLKAWQTGIDEQVLCEKYNTRIKADLDALKIEYDVFINPLDEKHSADFITLFTTLLNSLVAKGVTELRTENYQYSPEEDCFAAGCWIQGQCPVCCSGSGSYQCEECGTQYRPMDLTNPSFKRGNQLLTTVNDKELYLVVRDQEKLFQHLEKMQISAAFREVCKTYFKHQGNYIRLTNPGNWGIPYPLNDSGIPHVIFTYSALYFYSIYCGELYRQKHHTELNPFEQNSGVITVASFGIDCTVPYLTAGVALGLECDPYRPIDFILSNHFFTLEKAKFSTSRGHAIWGADIIRKTPVPSDTIRYFLALHNPEHEMADFSVDAFLLFANNQLANGLQPLLTSIWAALQDQDCGEADPELTARLEALLIKQNLYLTPPGFELKLSCLLLNDWIHEGQQHSFVSGQAYWWLKGFSLLSFPVMPEAATIIWHSLGYEGEPLEAAYFRQSRPNVTDCLPVFFETITFEELLPALPATLFSK